jgi:alpha-tubulin suppressor-like RCC1 family protein
VPKCASCRRPLLGNFDIDDRDWGAIPIDTNSRLNLRLISKTGIVRIIQISAPVSEEDSTVITRVNTGFINNKNYLDLIVPFANIDGRSSGVRFVLYRLGSSPQDEEDATNDGVWAGYSLKTVRGETSGQGIAGAGDVVRQVVATGATLEKTYLQKDRLWTYEPEGGKEFGYKTRLMPLTSMSLWPKAKIGYFLQTQEEYPSVWRVWACASMITFSQYLRIAGNAIVDVINVKGTPSSKIGTALVQQISLTVQWLLDDDEVFEIMRDDWMRAIQNRVKNETIVWTHEKKVALDTVLSLSRYVFGTIFDSAGFQESQIIEKFLDLLLTKQQFLNESSSNIEKAKFFVEYAYLVVAAAKPWKGVKPIPLNAAIVNDTLDMFDLFANKTDEFVKICQNRGSTEENAPTTGAPETPSTGEPSSQPVKPIVEAPPSASTARSLHVGRVSTCVIYLFGNLKCWGENQFGQLGDGTRTNRDTPVAVVGLGGTVKSVAKSRTSTCALLEIGAVECWGHNRDGQLGDGTTRDRLMPTRVSSLGTAVAAISGAERQFCALMITGAVKCWGLNHYGELGNGLNRSSSSVPVQVQGLTSGVTSVSLGTFYSCAVLTGGSVKCWGRGDAGQLGNGFLTDSSTPVQVATLTSGVASVSAGTVHSCALRQNGSVVCWGRNTYGERGDGTVQPFCTSCANPNPGEVTNLASGVSMIALGDNFSCAVLIVGSVKCWGRHEFGRLGNGFLTGLSPIPVQLPDLISGVASITTSSTAVHACAGLATGAFKCWGSNQYAETGTGSRSEFLSQPLFVRVL